MRVGDEFVSLSTPGPGIQTSAVFRDEGGGEAVMTVRRAEDEELLVL